MKPQIYKVRRTDLPQALKGGDDVIRQSIYLGDIYDLGKGDIGVGFWGDESRTPDFVVVNNESTKEFLAWVRAYVPAASPLSQWCRVVAVKDISDFLSIDPVNDGLGRTSAAWAGAIIGECIAQTGREDARTALNVLACRSTYSFAAARTLAIWGDRYSWGEITDQIDLCHSVLSHAPRRLEPKLLFYVWDVLRGMGRASTYMRDLESDQKLLLSRCCYEVAQNGTLSDQSVKLISAIYPDAISLGALDELSAEQCLLLLRAIISNVVLEDDSKRIFEFVVGYVASKIGGGWRNIDALADAAGVAPLAPVWFGVLHMLIDGEIYGANFEGLARLVMRELTTHFHKMERPQCDISLDELRVIQPSNVEFKSSFRTEYSRVAQVELLPGVTTSVSFEPRREQPRSPNYKPAAPQLAQEGALIAKVERVLREVEDFKAFLQRERHSVSNERAIEPQPVDANLKKGKSNPKARQRKLWT